jgi:hypothetical protein
MICVVPDSGPNGNKKAQGRGIVILIQVVRVQFRRLKGEKESPKIGYGMLDGTGSST